LTGRLAIWSFSLNAALERPWFGNGFDSMWKVFPPFGSDQFEARHAENELLQQFFAYGLAGIAMLCGLYGSLFRSVRRLPPGSMKTILLGLLLFILIRGFAEAEPFDFLLPLWMMTVLSSIVANSQSTEQAHLDSAHADSSGTRLLRTRNIP
jgi:O-antigen ligase